MTTYSAVVTAQESAANASGVFSLIWLLVALPLFGAAVLLLGGRRTDRWGHWLGVAMPVVAFVLGAVMFLKMLSYDSDQRAFTQDLYTWIKVGSFDIHYAMDRLSGPAVPGRALGFRDWDPEEVKRLLGDVALVGPDRHRAPLRRCPAAEPTQGAGPGLAPRGISRATELPAGSAPAWRSAGSAPASGSAGGPVARPGPSRAASPPSTVSGRAT